MRLSSLALVCVVSLSLFACAGDGEQASSESLPPLPLPALHAEPDAVNGGRIVDADGREVLLRGVNVNSLGEYWAYNPAIPTVYPFTADDADRMASFWWNGYYVRGRARQGHWQLRLHTR